MADETKSLKYAQLADIVNGFDYAQSWRFVRKGKNDWSLVGLDSNGDVAVEVEHLFYSQLVKLCSHLEAEAPVESVTTPQTLIRREPVVKTLRECMAALDGTATQSQRSRALGAVVALLAEMDPKTITKEGTGDQTQVRGTGGRPANNKDRDPTDA